MCSSNQRIGRAMSFLKVDLKSCMYGVSKLVYGVPIFPREVFGLTIDLKFRSSLRIFGKECFQNYRCEDLMYR